MVYLLLKKCKLFRSFGQTKNESRSRPRKRHLWSMFNSVVALPHGVSGQKISVRMIRSNKCQMRRSDSVAGNQSETSINKKVKSSAVEISVISFRNITTYSDNCVTLQNGSTGRNRCFLKTTTGAHRYTMLQLLKGRSRTTSHFVDYTAWPEIYTINKVMRALITTKFNLYPWKACFSSWASS